MPRYVRSICLPVKYLQLLLDRPDEHLTLWYWAGDPYFLGANILASLTNTFPHDGFDVLKKAATSLPWAPERMCLGIQDPFVQRNDVRGLEEQVKILERLGEPEALHVVLLIPAIALVLGGHIADGAVAGVRPGRFDYCLEHAPTLFLPRWIARDAVHVPDGLDGLGSDGRQGFSQLVRQSILEEKEQKE